MNCDYAPTSTRLSTTASLASSRAIPSARINIGWGNGLSSCSEVQILKALALTPATEEQSEAVLAAVRETPELDLTETVRNDKDYSQFALAISTVAIALIAKEHSIE